MTSGTREFFQNQAGAYQCWHDRGNPGQRFLTHLVDRNQLSPEILALDLGCGSGAMTIELAQCVGHVVALDIAPAMLDLARQCAAKQRVSNIYFVLGDTDSLPFAADNFDLIVSRSVLQFTDLGRSLPAIRTVLCPEGHVSIFHRAMQSHAYGVRLCTARSEVFRTLCKGARCVQTQGIMAGVHLLKSRLPHIYFSFRHRATRLEASSAIGLYRQFLPGCDVQKSGDGAWLIRWSKSAIATA